MVSFIHNQIKIRLFSTQFNVFFTTECPLSFLVLPIDRETFFIFAIMLILVVLRYGEALGLFYRVAVKPGTRILACFRSQATIPHTDEALVESNTSKSRYSYLGYKYSYKYLFRGRVVVRRSNKQTAPSDLSWYLVLYCTL